MGRRNAHLAKRIGKGNQRRWIEACCEKHLRYGYVGKGRDARFGKKIPYHLGLTDDPTRVTCRACIMLLPPDEAARVARALEHVIDDEHRLDTVVLLVTREEVFKIRVPKLEPSSDRAELIATAEARGRGAVAARTKRGES